MIRKLFYILLSMSLIVAGIIGVSYFVNKSKITEWLEHPKLPGEIVTIDGFKVYATVQGAGAPSIVVFHGLGSSSIEWQKARSQLSTNHTVLTFDRPGYSWSEPSVNADICGLAKKLTEHYKLPKPIILVGHSIGAYFARACAKTFAGDLKGVLFLDPLINPKTAGVENIEPEVRNVFVDQSHSLLRSERAASWGIFRFLNMTPYEVPNEIRDDVLNNLAHESTAHATLAEYKTAFDLPFDGFPKTKVVVISHSVKDGLELLNQYGIDDKTASNVEALWKLSSQAFLALAPDSQWIEAKHGLFSIHLDHPEVIVDGVEAISK
jgi:pimeloyl-ACP methyl ester carboxylesterase